MQISNLNHPISIRLLRPLEKVPPACNKQIPPVPESEHKLHVLPIKTQRRINSSLQSIEDTYML